MTTVLAIIKNDRDPRAQSGFPRIEIILRRFKHDIWVDFGKSLGK